MTGLSALPLAPEEGSGRGHEKFRGVSRIIGPKWLHLPTTTIGFLGVQIFWCVEMSYASPYLLSLGLSKSKMAIVFVAGPLSGLLVQPLIGVLADNCTSKFGRRRPYMMVGTIICVFAMILLGFTRWFASIFTGWNNESNDLLTIWLAVFSIYLIDFSINAVMAVDRALLVDSLPSAQQPQAGAWAARMVASGAIVGFFVGNVDLTKIFPFLGNTQLQVLSVIASFLLLGSHVVMAILVKERILLSSIDVTGKTNKKSFTQGLKDIWSNIFDLPHVIRQICFIQFFASLGWFPVLFYTSIYIGDLYKRTSPVALSKDAQDALDAEATRLGSRALFWQAVIALIGNLLLPYFVVESVTVPASGQQKPFLRSGYSSNSLWKKITKFARVPIWMRLHLASLWTLSHLVFALCMFATFFIDSVGGASLLIAIIGFSSTVGHWVPFSLLATAILTNPSEDSGTAIRLSDTQIRSREDFYIDANADERNVLLPGEASESEDDHDSVDEAKLNKERRKVLGNSAAQASRMDVNSISNKNGYHIVNGGDAGDRADADAQNGNDLSAKAGIILGIQNIFIVIPQFLVTGFSSLIFAIFDPTNPGLPPRYGGSSTNGTDANILLANATEPMARAARGVAEKWLKARQKGGGIEQTEEDGSTLAKYEGLDSVVYIFMFGGIAATIAAMLSWRLARELRRR